jgi:non-ribosomal peptide synthetase component F
VVGITLAEQPSLGTEAQTLMGYCLNVLPLRVRGAVGESFRELLAETRRALAEAQEHQSYDVARLFKKLDLRRDPGRSPLFSVAFNHERGEVWKVPGGLRFEQAGSPNVASQYDLSLMTVELGGEIAAHCIYSADLFDRERIEGWLADYERLLAIVVREPGIALPELGERLRREAAEERRRTRELRRGASLAKLRALEGSPLASGQGS